MFKKIFILIVLTSVLLVGCNAIKDENPTAVVEPTAVIDTQATQIALLETKIAKLEKTPEPTIVPTKTPIIVTEPANTPLPITAACDTPSIKASVDGDENWTEMGLFLDTTLGKRMTYTSRSFLVPEKEWNVALTVEELITVEETWQTISICVPDGTTGIIFTGGFEQGVNRFETGALLSLSPGLYEFQIRNGEIVIWYPDQDDFKNNDLQRIVEQIRTGNFDIKSQLSFFAATTDLMNKLPNDLIHERNVQIANYPEPKE